MKVRIYKPHTHAGKRYTPGPEGVEIEVGQADVDFLRNTGVMTPPEAAATPATAGDAPATAATQPAGADLASAARTQVAATDAAAITRAQTAAGDAPATTRTTTQSAPAGK